MCGREWYCATKGTLAAIVGARFVAPETRRLATGTTVKMYINPLNPNAEVAR